MTACTCCFVDPIPPVPVQINNRPGLSAIAYRIGTFSSFRAALLDKISKTQEIAGLRTRASDDYSIALFELWSVVADILTFYQERIANEGYLRTATLRDSVLRLVRLIDYQLQPGLAATALLAFTLEPGASVAIPVGLRVQSVPAGNASPQKYETIEAITADARFNSLRILPAPEVVSPLASSRVSEIFAPGADIAALAATLAAGDRLVAYTSSDFELLTVGSTAVQDDRMIVSWKIPPTDANLTEAASGTSTSAGLFKVGRTFHLFGYNAPPSYMRTVLLDPGDPRTIRAQLIETAPLTFDVANFYLDALYDGIRPGSALLIRASGNSEQLFYATVNGVSERTTSRGGKTGIATLISASADGFFTPPKQPAPVVPGTGGSLNGIYSFVVTFVDDITKQESYPSPPCDPLNVNNNASIYITNLPVSTDSNVNSCNVYGIKHGGASSNYQMVANVPYSTLPLLITTDTWGAPLNALSVTIYELLGRQLRLLPDVFPPLLSSSDFYLSGRRNGWSSIEVGRTMVKGVIHPGVTIGVNDIEAGQEIIVQDADPTSAASATVVGTEIVGDQISLQVAGNDASTLAQMGLDPNHAEKMTALVSPPFASGNINLHNSRVELQVTIGQHPPQTISMATSFEIGPSGTDFPVLTVATTLTSAIQSALPDVPEFANAQSYDITSQIQTNHFLLVAPGTAAAPISFAPTPGDPDTIVDLGLDATHVRYLDGVLSGPMDIAGNSGTLTVVVGTLAAHIVSFSMFPGANLATVLALKAAINSAFGLDDSILAFYPFGTNQMVVFPPPALFEWPAYLRIMTELGSPIDLDSSTAVMLGNVARASQGETVANEIVGNGDASVPFQSFSLRKKPVTFLLGNGPHGAQSSLKVSVNGVRWAEVSSLYGAAPNDQVYVTRIADDTTLMMEFGDGTTGSRLPTGLANIVANYRKGVGIAGRVNANALTSLLDKANGVKRVTNPLPADGGADPQALEGARSNAPATVRTFGRAVSLQDFEDVALQTGEIAKANATWIWTGLQKAIYLTVAAQNGEKLSSDGIQALWATLLAQRDPNHQLFIGNFARVPIIVNAALTVDPRYSASEVESAAFEALVQALSFDQLAFGQAIHLSAIYGVLQNVDGVTAVDITDLNLKSQDPVFRKAHGADNRKPQPHLFMLGARPGSSSGDTVLPAELAWVDVPTIDLLLSTTGGSGS